MTKGDCTWTKEAYVSLKIIKEKLLEAPVLGLLDFDKLFQFDCGASHVGAGAEPSQEDQPIAYFSEKLNGAKIRHSTYGIILHPSPSLATLVISLRLYSI